MYTLLIMIQGQNMVKQHRHMLQLRHPNLKIKNGTQKYTLNNHILILLTGFIVLQTALYSLEQPTRQLLKSKFVQSVMISIIFRIYDVLVPSYSNPIFASQIWIPNVSHSSVSVIAALLTQVVAVKHYTQGCRYLSWATT